MDRGHEMTSPRKTAFTADGGPHKVERIRAVADGLRRIGESESAEMLTHYVGAKRQAEWWVAIVKLLDELAPDWYMHEGSGIECAERAIRAMAAKPPALAGAEGEA